MRFAFPTSKAAFVASACTRITAVSLLAMAITTPALSAPVYPWRAPVSSGHDASPQAATQETLESRIPPPEGFARIPARPGSFAEWLRGLPMKPAGAPVMTYTGRPKWRQDVHVAVIDIDVGTRDLQQCADAIMRLRAEWLFAAGRKHEIGFNSTEGKRLAFASRSKKDYRSFRKYMDYVFAYAGTYSLERELVPVRKGTLEIGDVFIKGGFPGHAVLVVDLAENQSTGERRFLLAQSYMPAQDIHILKDPTNPSGSPWYRLPLEAELRTPEWTFAADALRRWP